MSAYLPEGMEFRPKDSFGEETSEEACLTVRRTIYKKGYHEKV